MGEIRIKSGNLALWDTQSTEFQPYFLNRPAHQFVNNRWVDIPTHHYTNGRWQGELTSQSPLKFRADGEMLDWRVEGKTSPEPETIVYGFHVNPSVQDPSNAVTYLEDAVGMTPASMGNTSFNAGSWADAFFIPKPCMVRYDGTVDYYLDPSDYSKKADGTASDIADSNYAGNAMMEWGLIWFKFELGEADGEGYFYVSNKKVNDSFNCWCNYDANNNINPHFYTAIYNGTGTDKLRSISGVQLTPANGSGNTTGQQEITRAMANNTSELTEWYIDLWADRILVTGLLYLMGKSLNLQATFGRGLDSGGYTAKNAYVTGTLNDKGLFWGDTTGGNNAVKVFGMENLWGCCWHRTAGLFGTSTGYAYKLTHGTVDGSTATEFGTNANGYIPVTATQPENGQVTKMLFGKQGMLPSAVGGSTSTYYCDYFIKGNNFAMVGGNTNYGLYCGFYVALHQSADNSDWSLSTSLSLKPRARAPYNPHNGVGDWDETEQKYRIPVKIDGKNLWDGTFINTSGWGVSFSLDDDGYMVGSSSNDPREWGYSASQIKMTLGAGTYALVLQGIPPTQSWSGAMIYTSNGSALANNQNLVNKPLIIMPFTLARETSIGIMVKVVNGKYKVQLLKGTYTSSTVPPYEVNLYTDHQLLDGDSIDYTTTETQIPIATGNNVLTVDTAVQPKSVFVKFEG